MSDLPSYRSKIQTEATRFRSAVSESLAQDIGSSINYLIDQRDTLQAEIDAVKAAGDTVVVFGNNTNQFPGALDIISLTRDFAATDYCSIEFRSGWWGWSGFVGTWPSQVGINYQSLFPSFWGSTGGPNRFTLTLYAGATVINSAQSLEQGALEMPNPSISTGNRQVITFNPGQYFFQPGAGSKTIRLYKNGNAEGYFFGQIILKVHQHI